MGIKKLDSGYLYFFFAAIWFYCFVVSVLFPPFQAYYTFDETFIADSGVFLWYGITPRILDWPAAPSVLIYGIIFGISAVGQVLTHLSEVSGILDALVIVDKTAYEYLFHREPYILAGRAVHLIVILVVGLWTIRFLIRQQHPFLEGYGRVFVILVIASSHLIWNGAPVLRPEGLAGIFFMHILCRLLFSERLERSDIVLLSILYGVVVAERLIFLILGPLFFGGIWLLSSSWWRSLRLSVGVFVLSFLAFCPFVLTDPLIIAKAFFGGIMAKVNDNPMQGLFNTDFILTYFENPVSYLTLLVTAAGIYKLIQQRKLYYWVVIANWMLFLVLVLRSSKIYDPHVLPAALIHLAVIGIGLGLVARMSRPYARNVALVVVALIVLGEGVVIVKYHNWVRRDVNTHKAAEWITAELPNDARVATNIDIGLLLAPNSSSLNRWIDATTNPENQLRKLRYLMGFKPGHSDSVEGDGISYAAAALAFEDEKLFELQYRLLERYGREENRKRFDLDIYVEDNTLFYHGVPLDSAQKKFEERAYDYWVTFDSMNNLSPVKEFEGGDGPPVKVYRSSGSGISAEP